MKKATCKSIQEDRIKSVCCADHFGRKFETIITDKVKVSDEKSFPVVTYHGGMESGSETCYCSFYLY